MSEIVVRFRKLHPEAVAPTRKTAGSAGWDLCVIEGCNYDPERPGPKLLKTGIAVEIPQGYVGLVSLRSSIGARGGVMNNSPGIIDSDYRGEIKLIVSGLEGLVDAGDRVAQLIIHKLPDVEFIEASELSETDRGNSGFGSTGR